MVRAPASRSNRRTRRNILLAEDNAVNATLAARLLEKEGHAVRLASNGLQVLTALEEEPFDLILMDVQMPLMDGLETVGRIRQREASSGRHIPVIALTAHAMRSDQDRCREAGMDGYLSKPIQAEALREAIARFLPARTGQDPAAPGMPGGLQISRESLLAHLDNDPLLLVDVVDLFLGLGPVLVAQMGQALRDGKAEALAMAAHTFRGAAGNFGATVVVDLAAALEQLARSGDLAAAAPLCRELEERAAEVGRILREIRDEVASVTVGHG